MKCVCSQQSTGCSCHRRRIVRSPADGGGREPYQAAQTDRSRGRGCDHLWRYRSRPERGRYSWCSSARKRSRCSSRRRRVSWVRFVWPRVQGRRRSSAGRSAATSSGVMFTRSSPAVKSPSSIEARARVSSRSAHRRWLARPSSPPRDRCSGDFVAASAADGRVALLQVRFVPVHQDGAIAGVKVDVRERGIVSLDPQARAAQRVSYLEEGERKLARRSGVGHRGRPLVARRRGRGASSARPSRGGSQGHRGTRRPHGNGHRGHRPGRGVSLAARRDGDAHGCVARSRHAHHRPRVHHREQYLYRRNRRRGGDVPGSGRR